MRVVLLVIMLSARFMAYGQLSPDELKNRFTTHYLDGFSTECAEDRNLVGPHYPVFEGMQELFAGCFEDVSIYLVRFRDSGRLTPRQPLLYPEVYAVDNKNGSFVTFEEQEEFIKFINTTRNPIANVDKAYLYLSLFLKVHKEAALGFGTGAYPAFYAPEIRVGSVFAGSDSLRYLMFDWPGGHRSRDVPPGLASSTVRRIVMYSNQRRCIIQKSPMKQRHQFRFDENGKLIDIATDTMY